MADVEEKNNFILFFFFWVCVCVCVRKIVPKLTSLANLPLFFMWGATTAWPDEWC